MASQFALRVSAHACNSLRKAGVMLEGRWSHPKKSLPGHVPSSSACWAAFTLGSKASTAPASRKQAALVMSRLIFFIAIVVLEITDCKDTTFFELTYLIYLFYRHFCFFSFVFQRKEFGYRIFVVSLPTIVE
jgi:hypothetical protein